MSDEVKIVSADRGEEGTIADPYAWINQKTKRLPWGSHTLSSRGRGGYQQQTRPHTIVCKGDGPVIQIWQENHQKLGKVIAAALNEAEERGEL